MVVMFDSEKYEHVLQQSNSKPNTNYGQWLKTQTHNPFYFGYQTYQYCFAVTKKLKDNYDHITVVCGTEGVGKSWFASQLVSTISPGSTIDHVCYKPRDFLRAFKLAKKGDSIWLDEGALFLFSREANSRDNKRITKLLTICRQRNIHLVICIPNFFILDSYVRDHRVSTLFQLTGRGKFTCFNKNAIALINKWGAPTKNVFMAKCRGKDSFKGHFNNVFGENEDLTQLQYLELKHDHMTMYVDDLEKDLAKEEEILEKDYLSKEQVLSLLDMEARNFDYSVKNGNLDFEFTKLGSKYIFPRQQFIDKGLLKEPEKAPPPERSRRKKRPVKA